MQRRPTPITLCLWEAFCFLLFATIPAAAELAKVFTNLEYSPRERFGNAELESLKFFSHLDYINGDDLITAEYKGLRFNPVRSAGAGGVYCYCNG